MGDHIFISILGSLRLILVASKLTWVEYFIYPSVHFIAALLAAVSRESLHRDSPRRYQ